MYLTSPTFKNGDTIPKKYTCEGSGINPPLRFVHAPANVQSFAILVHDPDAPDGDFVHWILWNIEPSIREIAQGTAPLGSREGVNDVNEQGWIPPCPPSGTHHYEFHLYALDQMLALPEMSTREAFLGAIEGHVLEETVLVGLYKKKS